MIRNRLAGMAAVLALAAALGLAVMVFAQSSPPAAKRAAPSEPAVAIVGGRRIPRAAFEQRVREAEQGYRERSNSPVPAAFRPTMRRQVLEAMIREQLLILEARRRGMTLSPAQAEEEVKKDPFFQRDGVFDEAKFLAVKNMQPVQFRHAIETMQNQMPAIRLKQQLERENAPNATQLKAEIERELSEVTIDFLALRRGSFSVERPEPSEREVLDLYRAHVSEYPRAEQVVLTILTVQKPELDPSDHDDPALVQAWEARMKDRADSLLAALKKGGKLESLAPTFGTLSTGLEASPARFPGIWRGSSRLQQAVFSTPAGGLLGESVPGKEGFLLVRVDQHRPPHTPSLKEIAVLIRERARADVQARIDKREREEIYVALRDSLRGRALRVRYAVADTGVFPVAEPTAGEIDRYYRGHLADYSFFDSKTSSVGSKPLSEVKGEVRRRLLQERRNTAARTAAEQLLAVWKSGKRDNRLERSMTTLREVGPVPVGAVVDTGLAGAILTDTLAERPQIGVDMMRHARGYLVYHVFGELKDYTPTIDEARPMVELRRQAKHAALEEQEARRFFDQNPSRFKTAQVVTFSRLMVNAPEVVDVPLSRDEVERYYRSHPDDYGAPELAHARHILITPKEDSPRADAEARARAEDILRRLKAGESFSDLARQYSDDAATRDKGGDVGVFRHGMMLDDFERAAFAMRPGDVRGPVKSEVGYHIIECLDHVPAEVTPLRYAYTSVAAEAAREKANRIARFRADSLRRVLKNGNDAARVSKAMSFALYRNDQIVGSSPPSPYLKDYFARIEKLKPGQFDDQVQEYRGMGYAVTWVDSVGSQSHPSWKDVHDQALDAYRRERGQRELRRKQAELDSLLHAGWSFDSLSTLYGGLERHGPRGPGSGLEFLSGRELLDSLAFGTSHSPPALVIGTPTGWIDFPGGVVMMRLVERRPADPVQVVSRVDNENRGRLEIRLRKVYDKLKERYPVEIVDQELRLTELPPVPGS